MRVTSCHQRGRCRKSTNAPLRARADLTVLCPGYLHPLPQRLRRAAHLPRDRLDRRPLRRVVPLVLQDHADRPLSHLRCELRRSCYGSILSKKWSLRKSRGGFLDTRGMLESAIGGSAIPSMRWCRVHPSSPTVTLDRRFGEASCLPEGRARFAHIPPAIPVTRIRFASVRMPSPRTSSIMGLLGGLRQAIHLTSLTAAADRRAADAAGRSPESEGRPTASSISGTYTVPR